MAGRKGSSTEVKEECSGETCGACKKMVSGNDKGISVNSVKLYSIVNVRIFRKRHASC
jgi:hypothetical protein